MQEADLGLFDFDRHNALYFFIMNADEQIYMRYGGRDSRAADTYLNLRSLELALREGLEMHRQGATTSPTDRPAPLFAREIPLLAERTIKRNQCVECHLIGDYQLQHKEIDGTLDPLKDMFVSPDIKTIGIFLDVPKGLAVAEAKGAVADAGLRAGDTITHVEGVRVRTFADLQYRYGKLPREATTLLLGAERDGKALTLPVTLPPRWWYSDVNYRHWTTQPLVHFRSEPLSEAEKQSLQLPPRSFASKITYVDLFRDLATPALKVGDILIGVGDAREDENANTAELYITLHARAGSEVVLHLLRNGKPLISKVQTERQNFRK